MLKRYALASLGSAAISFGLFFTMQALVANQSAELKQDQTRWQLDFVRLKRDESVNRKERARPEKAERPERPPTPQPTAQDQSADVAIDIPLFDAALTLGGGPGLAGGGDGDVVPMVRVNPQYPARAASRGIEGWVHLKFTVTPQGTTDEIEVVEADPRGYFETAAKNAVKRYKYKPRVEGGQALARPGIEVVLVFELEK